MISESKSESSRTHQFKMLGKMQEFLTTTGCRRCILLKHFEEEENAPPKQMVNEDSFKQNCCDNCTERLKTDKSAVEQKVDVSKDALKVTENILIITFFS